MSAKPCKMRSPPTCPWSDLRNTSERSNLRLLMHRRWRKVVSHNSASAASGYSETRWRTRASAAASQLACRPLAWKAGCDNPSGQRLTSLLPFPHGRPSPVPNRSSPSAVSCPAAPKVAPSYTKSFFIDTIVYIDVLNDKPPSKRLILSQRFGVQATPEGFIQWEVSSFVTFESKS
jgi:hypothetical protein